MFLKRKRRHRWFKAHAQSPFKSQLCSVLRLSRPTGVDPPSTPTRKPPAHTSLSRVCSSGNPTAGTCHFRDGHSRPLWVFTWVPSPSLPGLHLPHCCPLSSFTCPLTKLLLGEKLLPIRNHEHWLQNTCFILHEDSVCLVHHYSLSSQQRPWHSANICWITRFNTSSNHHIKTSVSWDANLQSQHSRRSFACACPEHAVIRAIRNLTGSSVHEPTPCSGGSDWSTWHRPLCLLLCTWPHMGSAPLFATSYQRSLRLVSCPMPSQTKNGWKLTKKELLSRGRSVEKVRKIGTIEETFPTFHSPPGIPINLTQSFETVLRATS